ncbi:hypothetical protein MKW98_026570, partial [Papaver atlanticum]
IERLVRLIMEEGNNDDSGFSLRRKAKELQILVTKAVGEDGSSYNSLSEVVRKWKSLGTNGFI